MARTEVFRGYRFDIGGHRFYTKIEEVDRLWREMLGEDFRSVRRLSRIFYGGGFYAYPLELFNTLSNLGVRESLLIVLSYLRVRLRPVREEENLEQWVTNRFGSRLYRTFFQSYTEKVWGTSCQRIRADWAAQRIKGLSLTAAVWNAVFGDRGVRSLVNEFHYPVLGPGMMWERFREAVEQQGGQVWLGSEAVRVHREVGGGIRAATVSGQGGLSQIPADHFISTVPLADLIARLDPPAPPEVSLAASRLRYRDFILVGLILDRPHVFPDQWIYVHSPAVKVGRIQNFKNWSPAMVPDPRKTSLGMEYFCSEGDAIWTMADGDLVSLAAEELEGLGLARRGEVEGGVVFRQRQAYPLYDEDYRSNLDVIQRFLSTIPNLQSIGRNGLHRYNNQDHSMLTALLAVRNILGGPARDLWSLNTERSYGEEFEVRRAGASRSLPAPALEGQAQAVFPVSATAASSPREGE